MLLENGLATFQKGLFPRGLQVFSLRSFAKYCLETWVLCQYQVLSRKLGNRWLPTSQPFVALLYCRATNIFESILQSDLSCIIDIPPRHLEEYRSNW